MACNEYKNPLQRGGTDQQQRQLAALKSDYVSIDERDYKEWIVFANQFAGFVKYFDVNNNQTNNWQPFFNSDISAILGTVAIQDINEYRLAIKEKFDAIHNPANKTQTDLLRTNLNALFSGILSLTLALDSYCIQLPESSPLKAIITNLIKTKLQAPFASLLTFYKSAYNSNPLLTLVKESDNSKWTILNRGAQNPQAILTSESVSPLWLNGSASLHDLYNSLTPNPKVFGPDPAVEKKIIHLSRHNLFTGIFDTYLQTYTRIINEAEGQLLVTLTNDSTHTPHYALFITFLKLFKYAKQSLNTLTQRHLDFYYKEVLKLTPKKANPSHAHVIIELAKQVDEFMLAKGSAFKAGKDALGKDVTFTLDADTVFNKAGVAKLMSIYRGDDKDNIGTVINKGRWFASPVANSADGLGAKLKTLNGEWHPFYNKEYFDGALSAIDMPKAQIGFAIASHYLFLNEGQREVNLNLEFAGANQFLPVNTAVDCYVTTAKGWYKVPDTSVKVINKQNNSAAKECSAVYFILQGNDPAVVNYNPKVHGGTFKSLFPILKVYLKNEDATAYQYDDLKDRSLTSVEINVSVGGNGISFNQNGIKQLQISGDSGLIDSSKPFQPFGAIPKPGASFIIGNQELFTKKGAVVLMNIEWANMPASAKISYPSSNYLPATYVQFIKNGTWAPDGSSTPKKNLLLFSWGSSSNPVLTTAYERFALDDGTVVNYTDSYEPYDTKTNQGFLKITLDADLGFDTYQADQVTYLIKLANKTWTSTDGVPFKPYSPTIKSIYISYNAVTNYKIGTNDQKAFDGRAIQYYHLSPFGEAEQSKTLNPDESVFMLPQFNHAEENSPADDVAEFFIGLDNLAAQQSVNILFQVLEGTSDPVVSIYKKLISWNYLSSNQWKAFTDQQVVDGTAYLRQSGIISFQIPEGATTDNTIMPAGYLWIKASISIPTDPAAPAGSNKPGAVCKLLNVLAQAAQVTFADNGNDPAFLSTALPGNTISKLANAQTAIKKITQPYPSFEGKPVEDNTHFYVRASERLRHKDRAITIWDYERLVLEAFPEIHRVKCLNHTKYENGKLYEDAPGYVTVITIPDLTNHNEINPLRPYTNADTITQIQAYLQQRVSCQVNLNVNNPIFEEVQLVFKLKLYEGRDYSYYSKLLKDSITRYLSPWAYGQADDVQFGGKIEKSVLINFIEAQYYVDYITDVQLFLLGSDPNVMPQDQEEIEATTSISILVSVPADKHNITEIPDVAAAQNNSKCADPFNMISI
ncbi:baseplate J/gp47 family protein [Mucilaginibacter sp. AW1-7]|uniref:baseplate J/gp47 family protein n=1 Tax=Mucilaginibacter sp. AW1-7 TaxID=3349874 RepID=UPI003F7364FE